MLSTWFSSFILSVFILGIYSICIRLDAIAGNTNKGKKSRASENTSIHEEKDEDIKEKDEDIKEKDEENKKFIWE